jgi:acyl carrier protein
MTNIEEQIREVLSVSGRLAVPLESLDREADLFGVGLDSLAIVNVLMSLEERFDIELPDELLSRRSFSSIATIEAIVAKLADHTAGAGT